MSEHTLISSEVDYLHLPYRKDGFSYCKHCKKFCDKLEVQFNEGWFSDWQEVRCGKCHKAIWICEFKRTELSDKELKKLNEEDLEIELLGSRIFVKNDKKCEICGKPTNHYDCLFTSISGLYKKGKEVYICSRKCEKEFEKIEHKLVKEENLKRKKNKNG